MSKWKQVQVEDKLYHLNTDTGEVLEDEIKHLPKGTMCIPPDEVQEQQEALQRKMKGYKKKIRNDTQRMYTDHLGNFLFVSLSSSLKDLPAEHVIKLMYLMTYIDFNGVLKLTKRTYMKMDDIAEVLDISDTTAWRFKNEVIPKYFSENEDGILQVNNEFFKRGTLTKNDYRNLKWRKAYLNGIRQLYEKVTTRNQKHLGYIFQLIPYINFEYNILCWNPEEDNIEKIVPMTLGEFCEQIGFDLKNVVNLLKIYRRITFNVNGKEERFVAIVGDGVERATSIITVNPNVMYSGQHYQDVASQSIFYCD